MALETRTFLQFLVLAVITHYTTGACEALGIEGKVIPDGRLTSSTPFNGSTPAKNARLNFVGLPWCAVESASPLYLQVDLTSLHAVCAVATQGNSEADQWVQTYQLKTSTDGTSWADYEEEGQIRDFQGNADSNTTVKQVLFEALVTKYVRIVPTSCQGFCCLRVELYGTTVASCQSTPVGIENRSLIPDYRITATSSSSQSIYKPYQARFTVTSCAWEPGKRLADSNQEYLQVDLGGVYFICAVATKGNGCLAKNWVSQYKIYLSSDNSLWSRYNDSSGAVKLFTGNKGRGETIKTNNVAGLPRAKFIRIWPTAVGTGLAGPWAVLRLEVYGAVQGCRVSLGMESNTIKDSQITAKPNTNTPSNGRLYKTSTWCSTDASAGYMEVDLGEMKTVTGVATQGHHSINKWVKTYHIGYKYDSSPWQDYKLRSESGSYMMFDGNWNKNEVRVNWFPVPVVARYIRVIADSWTSGSGPCLRIDLYGCRSIWRPRVTLEGQFLVPTRGNFTCKVTSQPNTVIQWWNNNKDLSSLSTSMPQSNEFVVEDIISSLRVDLEYQEFDSDCKKQSALSVQCKVQFSCIALMGNRSETQAIQTAVLYVTLPYPQIGVSGHENAIRLSEGEPNIIIECFGYGKPAPKVRWKKDNLDVSLVPSSGGVFQQVFTTTNAYPWNVTSRLYLGVSGVALKAAGTYKCEVSNTVDVLYKERRVKVTSSCETKELGIQNRTIIPDQQFTSSPQFNGSTPAKNCRLNYLGLPWCAAKSSSTQYLQIDLGSEYAACAVATQGNSKADQWVEMYQLQTSTDGTIWVNYTEGGQTRDFQGNADRNTTVKQVLFEGVTTRHVRIVPKRCQELCCLRLELYGATGASCQSASVGIADRLLIPDYRITATSSSSQSIYKPYQARFTVTSCAWEPGKTLADSNQEYLQVDLGGVYFICAVATKGNGCRAKNWVSQYKIYLSSDNSLWNRYNDSSGAVKLFTGNKGRGELIKTNNVAGLPRAKFIRIWPTAVGTGSAGPWAVLRLEVYGAVQGCRVSLGMEDDDLLKDSQITAQPNSNIPSNGRLYKHSASWCSTDPNAGYMEVDLGQVQTVTGVATQGHHSSNRWVKSYHVSYRHGSSQWQDYKLKEDSGSKRTFNGNVNKNEVRVNWFPVPVVARYIRVIADSWTPSGSGPCLRIDLYGCPHVRRPQVILESQFQVPTRANLTCKVTSQPNTIVQWRNKNKDLTSLSTSVAQSASDSVDGVRISSIRVDFEHNEFDYDCERKVPLSSTVRCKVRISCMAFLAGSQSKTQSKQTSVLSVSLPSPHIEVPGPAMVKLREGQNNITIGCFGYGKPAPIVRWQKDGRDISLIPSKEGVFQKVYNTISVSPWNITSRLYLGVSGASLGAGGNYTCEVSSALGSEYTVERTVEVTFPPRFIKEPRSKITIEGESATFICNVSGFPRPAIVWSFNGARLPDIAKSLTARSLTIFAVRATNIYEGNYTCAASNKAGAVSKTVTLTVHVPSRVSVSHPHTLHLVRNATNITVGCIGYGKPTPSIQWKKDGNIVQTVNEIGSSNTEKVVQVKGGNQYLPWNVTSRLYMRTRGVTFAEAGNYTCEVSNGVPQNKSVTETIEVLFPPTFTEEPSSQTVLEGCNVTFRCRASGMPTPHLTWSFSEGILPIHAEEEGIIEIMLVKNTDRYEGIYACQASNKARKIQSTAELVIDVAPKISPSLKDVIIPVGERLVLTCNVSADPAAQILWTKDNSELPSHATLDNKNSTLIIENADFDNDGRYTCVATNRQGNDSSSATIEVQASGVVKLYPAKALKLLKNAKNVTVDCRAYGKPRPSIKWMKGQEEVALVNELNVTEVVQIVFNSTAGSPWNVTSRLYVRVAGATYQEAGNYSCQVYNGVGHSYPLNKTIEVLFTPEFDWSPKSKILLEGSNATFLCNATGVPSPKMSWRFRNGSLPQPHSTSKDGLTLFSIQNAQSYEGNYTCFASNRAGVVKRTGRLTVESSPKIWGPLQDVLILVGGKLQLTCNVSADPAANIVWTKDNLQLPANAKLNNNKYTLVIESVVFDDDGRYTCVATNRQGNASSSATVEVQALAEVKVHPSHTLKLLTNARNITVDCMAYGKPTPSIRWMKGNEEIKLVDELNISAVVQVMLNATTKSPWNVTSRLYLRVAGATYEDAGNYTCLVHNGVGHNSSLNATIEVLFRPEFDLFPESKNVLEGSNVTLSCNATGVPRPTVFWKFGDGSPPLQHITGKDSLTLFSIQNDPSYEGNYTCIASNAAGDANKTVQLAVDSLPKILPRLTDVTIHTGERLELICNSSADPPAQILWTKEKSQLAAGATLKDNNSTLVINSVVFGDDGRYTCVARNRQGYDSSTATVTVQASAEVHLDPSRTLQLLLNENNITVDCMAYGKPLPSVKWMKGTKDVTIVNELNANEVVQTVFNTTAASPWNVTSRLYLRVAGATYEDAGNYTCQVHNGVRHNISLNANIEVLFRPQFDSSPKSKILLEGSNATFSCNATGVPTPRISWTFNSGSLPYPHSTSKGGLTLFMIQNDPSYEGNYTCSASSRAGVDNKDVGLTVDSFPRILSKLQNGTINTGKRLKLTCNASADPAPQILWTKDNSWLPQRAALEDNNSTLIISSTVISDEGTYTCTVINRQGSASSSATVEVQASHHIYIPKPHTLKLKNDTKNITVDCHAYGKPLPTVVWKKDGKGVQVSELSEAYGNQVVQVVEYAKPSQWNVTNRLYLRTAGITYKEGGIYTCEVFNGVGTNYSEKQSIEVLFVPQFTERPSDRIVIEGQNVTFPCKVSGMPEPSVKWNFSGGSLPNHKIDKWDLTLFAVKNTGNFEGSYTCAASSRAGFNPTVARLVVDVPPDAQMNTKPVTVRASADVSLYCAVQGDPTPVVYWTKNGSRNISRAQYSENNTILTIISVEIADEGLYECVTINRAGNDSAAVKVNVEVPPKASISGSKTRIFKQRDKNVTITCYGNGHPVPTVVWKKGSEETIVRVSNFSPNHRNQVVQVVSDDVTSPLNNVTSQLFLRTAGITYEEAGNYSCTASNGVDDPAKKGVEVLFEPEFVIKPRNQTVVESSKVIFACRASGVPPPHITWSFSGGSLPPSKAQNGNLSINNIVNNGRYEGDYKCTAASRAGNISYTVSLTVHVPPRLIIKPNKSIIEERGRVVNLTCLASGDPLPFYTWTKNGLTIEVSGQLENDNRSLVLRHVTSANNGLYTCWAVNEVGNVSMTANLTVHATPIIVQGMQNNTTAVNGHQVNFTCTGESIPAPDVEWLKGSESITHASTRPSGKFQRVSQLIIVDVAYKDRGDYTCVFSNYRGKISSTSHLIVYVPVNITSPPSSVRIPIGEETTLLCTASGFPVPTLSWYYYGKPVTKTEEVVIEENVSEGKLMIKSSLRFSKVTREDSGVYTCEAKNLIGASNETANLTVLEKPDQLEVKFVQNTTTTVLVNWTVPFDGNAKIAYFSVSYNSSDGTNTRNVTSNKSEYNVTGLRPATVYKIEVTATNEQGTSAPASIIATTREAVPGAPRAVKAWSLSSRSIYVNWTSPAVANGRLTKYNIYYGLSTGNFTSIGNLTVGPLETGVNILDLRPHTNYSLQVQASTAVGQGNRSDVVGPVKTKEDAPDCPRNLTVTRRTATSISLRWRKPFVLNGVLRAYFVNVTKYRTDNITQYLSNDSVTYNILGLTPYTRYQLEVNAFTIRAGNCNESVGSMTDESVPGPPYDVYINREGSNYVIRWKSSNKPRGIIKNYVVGFLYHEDPDCRRIFNTKDNDTNFSVPLNKLCGGKGYKVYVAGRTSKGVGDKSEYKTVETPKRKPPEPTTEPKVWKNETTATTVVITIPEFSDVNGAIIFYFLIVIRVPKGSDHAAIPTPRNINEDNLVSYEDAFESDKPAAYVASQFKGTAFEKYRKFTVGNDLESNSNQRDRRTTKEYRNGPLEAGSNYKIFARGFATETEYSDSAVTDVTTEQHKAPEETEKPNESGLTTVIIIVAVIVVLVAVIVGAAIVYIRRKRNVDDRVEQRELQPLGPENRDEEGVYANCSFEQRQPIPVEQLKDDYLYKHANDNQIFKEEFKLLPSPGDTPGFPTADVGALPENRVKNRYGNIKAYDHSRVILSSIPGVPGSDYINANFIDGFNHPRKYIASQGPKPETEDDFWRMVWEQQSSVIVMLTKPVESGKVKCQEYWPSEGSHTYGKISVELLETEELMDYEIRTFSVSLVSQPQVKPRTVTHFFFTAWPDHDVPSYATGLLQFWKRVRATDSPHSPMIVHCSAGVGRTGTFIVIDAMMSQIEDEQEVDMFSFVTRIRGQRNFMVQRESQYVLCHYALLEAITFGNTEIAVQDLRIKVMQLGQKNNQSEKTGFERQFELLPGVLPEENDDFETASRPENIKKNRFSNVLPFDRTRVRLKDDAVYINASYVEGYQQKRSYIATQAPLQGTIEDFWTLVWEEGVACIVMLAQLSEKSQTPIIQYWPEKDSARYGSFMVTTGGTEKESHYIRQKLTLTEVESGSARVLYHFQCLDWAPGGVPRNPASLLDLIGAVQKVQQQTGNGPILVNCSDGIGRTGTFCALSTSLERVKIEQTLDVFIAARMLRTQRPGMVRTLNQYKFIYDAVLAYLESFEEFQYENFKLKS